MHCSPALSGESGTEEERNVADAQLESWPSLCLVPLQCCIRKRRIFFLCGVETLKKALKILKGLISGFKGALWGGGSDLL